MAMLAVITIINRVEMSELIHVSCVMVVAHVVVVVGFG
jgi:hypothetical protein